MNSIIKRLKKVAEGDLTVQMKTRGRSEFAMLNRHIANMIENTRKLIVEVDEIVNVVNLSAEDVEGVSGQLEQSSNGILEALEEIDIGVSQQANDAQDCLVQMDNLSQVIEEVTEDIGKTSSNSESTKDAFRKIYNATEEVIVSVDDVKVKVKGMDKERAGTLEAISSISAVSEQTAASSSNVFSIAESQKETVTLLTRASDELKTNMEELKQAVSVFKTTEE